MIARSLALLALLAPQLAAAEDARPPKPNWDYSVPPFSFETRVFDFPTGLRILMQEDHSAPVVLVHTIVNAGFNQDPVGAEETAHFVEHAWFRSKHGDWPTVMELFQDIGARMNATTRNDWTDYRTAANKKFLPMLLQLESARLTEPYIGLTADQVHVEREVIRNEYRLRNEQDLAKLFDYLSDAVYPDGHSYGRASSHESLTNITFDRIKEYFDTWYKPQNTTIMVVGDFEMEEATSLIFQNFAPQLLHKDLKADDLFFYPRPGIQNPDQNNPDHWLTGAWQPGKKGEETLQFVPFEQVKPRITDEITSVPPLRTHEVLYRKAAVPNTIALVGLAMPGGFRADEWNYAIVGNVASSFASSAFTDEIQRKWVDEVACFPNAEVENTTMFCYAMIKNTDRVPPEDAAKRIIDTFVEVSNRDYQVIFEASLSRARQEALRDMLLNIDVVAQEFGARTETAVPHAHYTGSASTISDSMQRIMGLEAFNVLDAAAKYLRRDQAAVIVVEKLDEDEIDTTNQKSAYLGGTSADNISIDPSEDVLAMSDTQIAKEYAVPDLSRVVETRLDNGLRVVIVPSGEAPVVQATMVFGGGSWEEPYFLQDFAAGFVRSQGHDPLPIAAASTYAIVSPGIIDTVGSGWAWPMMGGASGVNHWTMGVRAPSGNLDGALWLLREEIETAHPFVDGKYDYVQDLKKYIEGDIRKGKAGMWDDAGFHIAKARNDHLFPESLHSRVLQWDDYLAVKDEWGAGDIDRYLTQHLKPSNAALIVVGNIDGPKALEEVRTYFAGWKPRAGADNTSYFAVATPKPQQEGTRILLYNDGGRTQSEVITQCRLNYAGTEDDAAVGVLGELLFNRAFFTLRVKEALSYTPVGYTTTSPDNTATMHFSSTALNTGVGRTVEVFLNTMREVEESKLKGEEMKLVKLREARARGTSMQSIDQLTTAMVGLAAREAPLSRLTDRGDRIGAVQPADLARLTKGCTGGAITTILGPVELIKPQLDERGMAYEVIEYRGLAAEMLNKYDPKAAKLKEKLQIKSEKKGDRKDVRESED